MSAMRRSSSMSHSFWVKKSQGRQEREAVRSSFASWRYHVHLNHHIRSRMRSYLSTSARNWAKQRCVFFMSIWVPVMKCLFPVTHAFINSTSHSLLLFNPSSIKSQRARSLATLGQVPVARQARSTPKPVDPIHATKGNEKIVVRAMETLRICVTRSAQSYDAVVPQSDAKMAIDCVPQVDRDDRCSPQNSSLQSHARAHADFQLF